MNEPHEADELIPWLPVHVAILASVHCGEFPFVFAGKRLHCSNESSRQHFDFFGGSLRGIRLPQVGAQIEIFHTQTITLAHTRPEVVGSWKIVKLWKMT